MRCQVLHSAGEERVEVLARGKQVCRVRLVEPAQAAVHLAHAAGPPREANAAVTGGQGLLQRAP